MPLFKKEIEKASCLIQIFNFFTVLSFISHCVRFVYKCLMGDELSLKSLSKALVWTWWSYLLKIITVATIPRLYCITHVVKIYSWPFSCTDVTHSTIIFFWPILCDVQFFAIIPDLFYNFFVRQKILRRISAFQIMRKVGGWAVVSLDRVCRLWELISF